jgi:DNA-binding NarL/FixJ family response regulator
MLSETMARETLARPTILVVDDQPNTLNLLIDAFEPAGFNVLVALAGDMALRLLDQITPDAILLDAMMPGIDGFETCRQIKLRPALALVPVIFMTGLTDTADILNGLRAGGVDYVSKPVVPAEIIARVRVHLGNAQLTRSAQAAMDASGRYLLAADAQGRLRWCTQQAARLLRGANPGDPLPADVAAWLRRRLGALKEPQADAITITMASETAAPGRTAARLEFALIGQLATDEFLLRIVELDADRDLERLHTRVPLTRREAEVLLWLSRGKSNRDIGQILGVSFRTVNKHLEQMYPKLGVDTRTAAVALAVKALEGR